MEPDVTLVYLLLFAIGLPLFIHSTIEVDDVILRVILGLPLGLWVIWTWERTQNMKDRLEVLEWKIRINERKER